MVTAHSGVWANRPGSVCLVIARYGDSTEDLDALALLCGLRHSPPSLSELMT